MGRGYSIFLMNKNTLVNFIEMREQEKGYFIITQDINILDSFRMEKDKVLVNLYVQIRLGNFFN